MTEGRSSLVHLGFDIDHQLCALVCFDIDHQLCALVRFDINGPATVNYVWKTFEPWWSRL